MADYVDRAALYYGDGAVRSDRSGRKIIYEEILSYQFRLTGCVTCSLWCGSRTPDATRSIIAFPRTLTVIASHPNTGKTTLALSTACSTVLKANKKVIYFNLDATKEYLVSTSDYLSGPVPPDLAIDDTPCLIVS